jgi:hypothetical protein
MIIPTGDNSWLVYQSSLAVLQATISGACRRNGRRSENFSYQYLKYLKGYLTRRKILRQGTSGFTFHRKEDVLRIFIALKNPSRWPGLNHRPLDLMASTLTTIPPRRQTQLRCMTWFYRHRTNMCPRTDLISCSTNFIGDHVCNLIARNHDTCRDKVWHKETFSIYGLLLPKKKSFSLFSELKFNKREKRVSCETISNLDKPLHKLDKGLAPLSLRNTIKPTHPKNGVASLAVHI